MIKTYNEGQTTSFEITTRNRYRQLSAPTAMRYRLDDSSGTQIIGWTSVPTPASQQTITIPAASNALLSSSHTYETRKLTVEITASDGAIIPYEITYKLKNLQFYPLT